MAGMFIVILITSLQDSSPIYIYIYKSIQIQEYSIYILVLYLPRAKRGRNNKELRGDSDAAGDQNINYISIKQVIRVILVWKSI